MVRMVGKLETPEGWVPEFEGQRPPFAPGNTVAVGNAGPMTHGAYSARKLAPIAQRIVEETLADPTTAYLRASRYRRALERWATSEARAELLEAWVEGMSMEEAARSDKGQTSPLELLRKWQVTAGNDAARMGLDPASAVKLGKWINQSNQASAATMLTQWRAEAERKALEADE